jgi:hypothetical protein
VPETAPFFVACSPIEQRRTGHSVCAGLDFPERDGNLLHDLDAESFQSRYPAGMIREQAYTAQIQIRKDLGAYTDLALSSALALRERGKPAFPVKSEQGAIADTFHRKSF